MNKNKSNHNLLTKEELVNLLEKKSGEVANLQELDEFEREAFEGFSVNSLPLEAQKMMSDMDLLLTQKLTELNSPKETADKKRGYIWFSLVASLALIIGLSVLFFKKENSTSEQNMALNEVTKKEVNEEKSSILEQPSFESSTINKAPLILRDEAESEAQKNNKPKINTTISLAKSEAGDDLKDKIAIGSAYRSNTNSDAILLDQEDAMVDSKLKSENINNAKSASVPENHATSSSPIVANYSKYDLDETKNTPTMDKEANISFTETKAVSKKSTATESISSRESSNAMITNAIYKTGVNDIKSFILDYEKDKPFTQKLKGSYEIKATIKTNGKLIVNSIENIDNSTIIYVDYLKQALNTMKDWKPSYKNGKAIESITNFKLEF